MKRIINYFCCAAAMAVAFASCQEPEEKVTPSISASPNSVTFSYEGETKNVAVTCNVDEWSYSGQPEWLKIVKSEGSLAMTADANPSLEDRTGAVTLTAGDATFNVEVKQEKGVKYPGYAELTSADAIYMGTLYQMFMPDCEGGAAEIYLTSEDERTEVVLSFFTTPFETAEEVVIEEGTYTLGDSFSDFLDMNLSGTPQTWTGGGMYVISDEEGDEEFIGGTLVAYTTGDVTEYTYCVEGTFSLTENEDGTWLIKTDFKDEEGNDIKYYYEGELEFDTTGALFPTAGDVDPTQIVAASVTYYGDSGFESTYMNIMLAAESGAVTSVDYYIPTTDFASLTDLSGTFMAPEAENTYAAGTLAKGTLLEMEGLSFPMGTFIMFTFGDYFVADGASVLMIMKDEGAETYTVMANLQNTDEAHEGYLIMASGLELEVIDGTAYEEED